MANSDSLTIPKGDYGFNITMTFKDSTGTARDMTGYDAKIVVWSSGVSGTKLIDAACSWSDQANGVAVYAVQSGDFDAVGTYQYIGRATKTGTQESTDPGFITVTENP